MNPELCSAGRLAPSWDAPTTARDPKEHGLVLKPALHRAGAQEQLQKPPWAELPWIPHSQKAPAHQGESCSLSYLQLLPSSCVYSVSSKV